MSKYVRFNGPGGAGSCLQAHGYEIPLGGHVEMEDDEAEQLANDPHVNVTVFDHEPEADEADPELEVEPEAESGEGHTDQHEEEE